MTTRFLAGLALLAVLHPMPAVADEGHGHDATPVAPTGPALPRFEATSKRFELVGVVHGRRVTLYLDRFEDNSPVKGATVEFEVGGVKVAVKEHADGEFEGELKQDLQSGVTPVTATVVSGNQADLLAADLDVHGAEHAEDAHAHGWGEYAAWGAGIVAAALVWAWLGRRSVLGRRAGGSA